MEAKKQDESFMRAAICEAAHADSIRVAPNPRVGAIIVEDGQIVAQGHYEQDGGQHAEKAALTKLDRNPSASASLYVTLEPCSTKGRTGACTSAILNSGISRVVVGSLDPTPEHSGSGVEILRDAGVEVVVGVLADECNALNPKYKGHSTNV